MTYTRTSLCLALCLVLAFSCGRPATEETSGTDTTAVDSLAMGVNAVDETEAMRDIIDYSESLDTDAETTLATFGPLQEVFAAARKAISFKDSLEYARQTQDLTDPADSALFMPRMNSAYEAILSYQQKMKSGIKLTDQIPKLIDLVRTPGVSDKTSEILPDAGNSTYLSHGNFFFMGGSPFMEQPEGPNGPVEMYYGTSRTENANYLFNAIYHEFGSATEITFGEPLHSYDSGPQEVNGIGSLTHTFVKPILVYFLTEAGPVQARLVSVRMKIVPESLGCISDQPYYMFTSSTPLQPSDILGIYIPYTSVDVSKVKVSRLNIAMWTADLNGDGVADLASVTGLFEGISSDTMSEVLWFVNIGGEWRIIDAGSDPDCT